MGVLRALNSILSAMAVLSLLSLIYTGIIITILTSQGFYLSEFGKVGTYDTFGERNTPDLLARGLTSYFADGSREPPKLTQFSLSERVHLRDVKLLVLGLKSFFYFCGFVLAAALVLMAALFKGALKRNLPRLLFWSGLSIVGAGILLSLLALSFTESFLAFHKLFFPQGNFEFPADSMLIRLFPEQFFQDAFLAILIRAGFFGLLLLALWLVARRKKNNQKEL
jgi:integral membrane protein (TIGR01906 family)